MLIALVLAGQVLTASAPAPVAPQDWLQARVDRIAVAAGLEPNSTRALLTDKGELSLDGRGMIFVVPRAVIVDAPSVQVVDSLLALMLSYRLSDDHRSRRVSLGQAAVFGALIAETGGASTGKDSKLIPLGSGGGSSGGSIDGREKALRGLRWSEAVGGCTTALASYLRALLHKPTSEVAAVPAQRFLHDMGSAAYLPGQPCSSADDPTFTEVRLQLSKAGI